MSVNGSSASPADALREQFGDRRPPDITRKITACVACRKQKIKCHMRDSQPPCTRCKKRGLSCTVNRSLQMLLEGDAAWKHAMERKIKRLEAGLGRVSKHLSIAELLDDDDDDDIDDDDHLLRPERMEVESTAPPVPNADDEHHPHNWEIIMDPDSGPAAIPGSVVSPVAIARMDSNRVRQDLISREVASIDEAQACLDMYQNRLDHFLYRILGERRTLSQIRSSSSLLLAAICAVGSLHLAAANFEKLHQEFVSASAAQIFARRHTVDDVRGLCIGAFWLSGISWACIGAAVRISTEIQLHRSIFKAIAGDRTHYLRTRLYYLVYVCDHHFSIPYGRPPMTATCEAVRANAQFLESEHAVEDDARLVSQVRFWQAGSEVFDAFGVDVEKPLDLSMVEPLRRFGIKFDNIRADWTERFARNQFVGNYPRKGVGLHYHFAKLYLYSHAFRGVGKRGFKSPDVALDIDELANSALLSATAILRAVVSDAEIQGYLNGLPTYFDLMIAFAVVFVLKVSSNYAGYVRVDTSETKSLVAELVAVLRNVTATMHPRHLLASVAKGAETLLERCSSRENHGPVPSNAHVTMSQPTFDQSLYSIPNDWNGFSFDNFYMGDFDFLSTQDVFDKLPNG